MRAISARSSIISAAAKCVSWRNRWAAGLRSSLAATARRPAGVLRTLNVPTLWLTGDEDIVYPPFLSDLLAPMMPNARVVRVPTAGHSVYFERPAEFNHVVDEFLQACR